MWQICLYATITIIFLIAAIQENRKHNSNRFLLAFVVVLVVLAATRNYATYPDFIGYTGYEQSFIRFSDYSIKAIINDAYASKDPVYHIIASLFGKLGFSFRAWICIVAIFSIGTIYGYIKKYSNKAYFSLLIYVSLGYCYFTLCGLRQTIAISFCILAYEMAKEKKLWKYFSFTCIGTLFHATALVMLPAYYIISNEKAYKKYAAIVIPIALLFIVEPGSLLGLIQSIAPLNSRFELILSGQHEGLNATNAIIYTLILLYCYIVRRKSIDEYYSINTQGDCFVLLIIGVFFRFYSMIIPEAFRIAMYYDIFIITYIPNCTSEDSGYKKRSSQLLLLAFYTYFLLFSGNNFNVFNY